MSGPRALLLAVLVCGCALAPPPVDPDPEPDWVALAAARLPMLAPCMRPGVEATLLCGTLEVPEDRSRPDGRRIELTIVVVPATDPRPPDDAVFLFEGGPGGAVTGRAGVSVHAGPARRRDIVLVDQRGTGGSHPLDCDLEIAGARDAPGRLREMFPRAAVAACLERLSAQADVIRYTSADHADDIEAVRRALGYGPINLRGGSYGTRAMMVYAQRYPASTRTLFGMGVDSPLRSNLAERGRLAERALAGIGRLCAADPDCAALTPDLDAMLRQVIAALDAAPRTVALADPHRPDATLELAVGRAWLSEQLRLALYYAFTSRTLPFAVHRAHDEGDWAPLVTLAVIVERMFSRALATGMALTVQCGEHMDFDTDAALEAGRATLFGSYRLAQQIQGCAAWRYRTSAFLGPEQTTALEIPTLLLSGSLDGVTPPGYAEDARALFPNSLHLVVEGGQHGLFELEGAWTCLHRLWADFLDAGSVDSLDTTCVDDLRRPPFLLDQDAFDTHVREALAPLADS